jgi:hypothetical protein
MKTEKKKDKYENSISSFLEGYDRDDHYDVLGDFEVAGIM